MASSSEDKIKIYCDPMYIQRFWGRSHKFELWIRCEGWKKEESMVTPLIAEYIALNEG